LLFDKVAKLFGQRDIQGAFARHGLLEVGGYKAGWQKLPPRAITVAASAPATARPVRMCPPPTRVPPH
jgi:hypothetical protein